MHVRSLSIGLGENCQKTMEGLTLMRMKIVVS